MLKEVTNGKIKKFQQRNRDTNKNQNKYQPKNTIIKIKDLLDGMEMLEEKQ